MTDTLVILYLQDKLPASDVPPFHESRSAPATLYKDGNFHKKVDRLKVLPKRETEVLSSPHVMKLHAPIGTQALESACMNDLRVELHSQETGSKLFCGRQRMRTVD